MLKLGLGKLLTSAAVLGVLGLTGIVGVRMMRSDLERDVYRERLRELAADYETLRSTYNEAVRRTAVTELIVEDGRLLVRVRSAEGLIAEIPTPYDPSGEIYVDFAVIEGRIWIRRVFDALTPPRSGTLIDPGLADIEWDGERAVYGKAVYRSLEDGRWVVSVSGDGSLGIERADGPADLVAAPEVRSFETIDEELAAELDRIGLTEIWRRWMGGQ